MSRIFCKCAYWQTQDFVKLHRPITIQPFVLRRHLARAILELPGRIDKDCSETLSVKMFEQLCGWVRGFLIHILPNL